MATFLRKFVTQTFQKSPNLVSPYTTNTVYVLKQVKFLFTTPSIDIVEKIVVYDVIDFFSDFGGFIGLFLGASCITFIDFAVEYLERAAERKKKKIKTDGGRINVTEKINEKTKSTAGTGTYPKNQA